VADTEKAMQCSHAMVFSDGLGHGEWEL